MYVCILQIMFKHWIFVDDHPPYKVAPLVGQVDEHN